MWNKLLIIAFILMFSTNAFPQVCDCMPATSDDTTRIGGNELVTLIENESYKLIQGKVFDVNGEALEGVLVEVFDKPDWIKDNKYSPPDDQKRIYACFTDKNGKFCFPKIAKENYEVRFSKDVRFNPTYLFLKVNPNSSKGRKNSIELYLTPGT